MCDYEVMWNVWKGKCWDVSSRDNLVIYRGSRELARKRKEGSMKVS